MIRSSHYSEIQESPVALCEVKCDPHVEKSSVKCGSLYSCYRGWYMIEPSHRSEIQEPSIAFVRDGV